MAVSGSNDLYASGMKMIARGVAALALLDDLAYFYYPLLRSRWRLCRLTDAAYPLRVKLCETFLTAALVGGGDVAGDALHDHVEGD